MKQRTEMKRSAPMSRGQGFKPSEPKPASGVRRRKCSNCGETFLPSRMGQKVCSVPCAQSFARRISEQQERKADKARKQAMRTRRDWMKLAQAMVNAYVRVRDYDLPCISCGKWFDGAWQAGHYLSRGARPNLALDPRNIAKQCMPCNVHLSGNQAAFRVGLVARIGLQAVEELEADHTPRKLDSDELIALRDYYRKEANRLKKLIGERE